MYLRIHGLPAHPLVVHATAVVVPAAALMVATVAVWSGLRRRAGLAPVLLAAAALVGVPVTTSTGEQLEARLPPSPLIERHAELADGLLPWVVGLFAAATVLAVMDWRDGGWTVWPGRRRAVAAPTTATTDRAVSATTLPAAGTPVALRVIAAILALVAATGTVVQVVRIGDAGARASWSDVPAAARPGLGDG
ncbi:DUF2231 domain-containing protein [Parafrankia sp. EUN1f]|uniref:DUF2231 domain-containing protein n=1 Tax=Parafrankia sp. EUN1f TaxID=102897 RepID=UPI0001C44A46|nr:DUF2231 domain-containing protein [Parafrankia sp. EUN1f]EFC84796.1 hypothetical protein FrEUN1fDRAFT_2113 [Parafrankia sp. EUN1f]